MPPASSREGKSYSLAVCPPFDGCGRGGPRRNLGRHRCQGIRSDCVAVCRLDRGCVRTNATFPLSAPARDQLGAGLRVTFRDPDAIYYRPLSDAIVIIRVLHGATMPPLQGMGGSNHDRSALSLSMRSAHRGSATTTVAILSTSHLHAGCGGGAAERAREPNTISRNTALMISPSSIMRLTFQPATASPPSKTSSTA
jgi:plasmid stabilization system protein ParE